MAIFGTYFLECITIPSKFQVNGYYGGQRFDTQNLTPFYLGHKSMSELSTVFDGQQLLVGSSEVSNYNSEKSNGYYSIDVQLNLKPKVKVGWIKVGHFKPKINCDLSVPSIAGGNFQTTRCKLNLWSMIITVGLACSSMNFDWVFWFLVSIVLSFFFWGGACIYFHSLWNYIMFLSLSFICHIRWYINKILHLVLFFYSMMLYLNETRVFFK